MNRIDTLTAAFDALTDRQLENLLWHVERGTPILCGQTAVCWISDDGG